MTNQEKIQELIDNYSKRLKMAKEMEIRATDQSELKRYSHIGILLRDVISNLEKLKSEIE